MTGLRWLMVVVVTGSSLLWLALARAEVGLPIPPDKKILGFAPDLVDTSYLKEHIAELERIPIDGLFIAVQPDWKKLPEGELYLGRIQLDSGEQYRREDYQQAIADLRQTKFNRFTDNFIDFSLCARNAYDWFDEKWSVYAENAGVIAHVAKEGKLKGFFIDVENYGGANVPVPYPFSYSMRRFREDSSERSFDEVASQVRKRGRELMGAIAAVYPDITIIMHPDMWGSESDQSELLSAFIDGLLEGGPQATLIDAGGLAYDAMLYENFSQMRQFAEKRGPERSQVPELYRNRMKYAYGLWVDSQPDLYGGWHTDPEELDMNYRSPERLEHSLYNALTVSDRYVWLFMIHPQVWWQPHLLERENVARQMEYSSGWRCVLCPHAEIPEAYLDAIRDSRKPHDINWGPERAVNLAESFYTYTHYLLRTIRGPEELSGENILANGGFEAWQEGGAPEGWDVAESSTELVSREDAIVREGSHSIKASATQATSHIYLIQSLPAEQYAGKTITFGVWIRSSFGSSASVNIIDFIETTGRADEGTGRFTRYEDQDDWSFITATKTIRGNAVGDIAFYLDNSLAGDGVVYYDGAIAVVNAE